MKSALQFLTLLAALCCCFAPVIANGQSYEYEYVVVGQAQPVQSSWTYTGYYTDNNYQRVHHYERYVDGVRYRAYARPTSPAIVSRSYSYQPAYTPSYSQPAYSYPVQSYSQPSYYGGGYTCSGGVCYPNH